MLEDTCRSQVAPQQREAPGQDVCVEKLPRGGRLPDSIDGSDVGIGVCEQHSRHIRTLDPPHSAEPNMVGDKTPSYLPGESAVGRFDAPGLRWQRHRGSDDVGRTERVRAIPRPHRSTGRAHRRGAPPDTSGSKVPCPRRGPESEPAIRVGLPRAASGATRSEGFGPPVALKNPHATRRREAMVGEPADVR